MVAFLSCGLLMACSSEPSPLALDARAAFDAADHVVGQTIYQTPDRGQSRTRTALSFMSTGARKRVR